ncbi:MAG: ribosomal RNA small subunit methyltransferase A [Magnetococcales bacterium]|nr:ribosomal RNA small subunit methyltransferase A [Magnetococcales bacterium]
MTSISQLLRQRRITPKKSLGQNFLLDPSLCEKIVRLSRLKADDRVVEIGPGLGSLTMPLLDTLERLHVIERDRRLIPLLEEITAPHAAKLTIQEADALQVDFTALAEKLGGPLRLVGNLPYAISTPLLLHALEHRRAVVDMTFMFQKEVAERIAAKPGTKAYGTTSVYAAAWTQATLLMDVPPTVFHPRPAVHSAVAYIEVLAQPPFEIQDETRFRRVIRAAFGQRRKTLRNACGYS